MKSLVLHLSIVLYYVTAWIGLIPLILRPAERFKEDERLTKMRSIGFRFMTIWNFTLHTVAFVGYLICDVLEGQQEYNIFRRKFKRFLDEMFYGLIVPTSILVSVVFWSLYLYDSKLIYIYPNLHIDMLTPWSNHTLHTNILPIAFLQVYHNKISPLKLRATLNRLMIMALLYAVCLYGTYYQKNIWVYPFLDHLFEPLRLLVLALIGAALLGIGAVFHRLNEWYCNSNIRSTNEPVIRGERNH